MKLQESLESLFKRTEFRRACSGEANREKGDWKSNEYEILPISQFVQDTSTFLLEGKGQETVFSSGPTFHLQKIQIQRVSLRIQISWDFSLPQF